MRLFCSKFTLHRKRNLPKWWRSWRTGYEFLFCHLQTWRNCDKISVPMICKPKTKGILHFQNGGYLFVASGTRISLSQRYICLFLDLKNTGIFSAAREEAVCFHAVFLSPAFLLRQLDEFKKASKPDISAAHHTSSERRPVVRRSALSARSPSAQDLPGRFAPDAPLQTASVYVKIVLDTQNCILFCVFKIFIWDFYAKSIFDVCWILSSFPLRGVWIEIGPSRSRPRG